MKLHFDADLVRELNEHSKSAKEHRPLYDEPETAKPGLWLVGDEGVYLLSNAVQSENAEKPKVAYADESNADTMEFADYRQAKVESYGGDDGIDYISAEQVDDWLESAIKGKLDLELTPTSLEIPIMVEIPTN